MSAPKAIQQICPSCSGEGSGSVAFKGLTSGSGMCPDCRGAGEVSPDKRKRLIDRKAA